MLAFRQLADGLGTPLLFLHGFLGSSKDWLPIVEHLKGKTCIGVDLPGHGASPFTENFHEELSQLGPLFHLIGYSMGGRLALAFSKKYPEKIASLTLISAHFGLPEKERPARLENDTKWAQLLLDKPIDDFLAQWYDQPIFKTLDREQMRIMRQKQNPQALAQALLYYSLAKQPQYEPAGHLIVGESDLKFLELYRNHSPHIIKKAGHAVHIEQPNIVAELIQRFTS